MSIYIWVIISIRIYNMVAHIMKFTLEGIGVIRGSLGHKLPVLGQISENVLVVSILEPIASSLWMMHTFKARD